MKKLLATYGKNGGLVAVLVLLLGLLAYVALRAGPLAPVAVTVSTVKSRALTPALFGIGTVEAKTTHKIGLTFAGRVKRVEVQTGDHVTKGQLLGEMDPVDLDDKIGAQEALVKRANANVLAVEASIQDVGARRMFAETQLKRYEQLLTAHAVSEEAIETKRQELQVTRAALLAARANLEASHQELIRAHADRDGLMRQRANLRLISPVDGIVTRRDADPGTTIVAGQAVVEVVEPESLWISVRFDQQRALGLRAQLTAQIILRTQSGTPLAGTVARIEPHADAVTEELLAKVEFNQRPPTLPPIGELAEVTVALAAQTATPVVPNASLQRVDGKLGVWIVKSGKLSFVQIKTGASDLDGSVQVLQGLSGGEQVVVYSHKTLNANSRIKVVDHVVDKSS
jgi:HlyD family secretion protein